MTVLCLFDMLYPEKEPLPVPDCTKTYATRQMAPTFIWIHLEKKAKTDRINLHRDVPNSLKKHHEYDANSNCKTISLQLKLFIFYLFLLNLDS